MFDAERSNLELQSIRQPSAVRFMLAIYHLLLDGWDNMYTYSMVSFEGECKRDCRIVRNGRAKLC